MRVVKAEDSIHSKAQINSQEAGNTTLKCCGCADMNFIPKVEIIGGQPDYESARCKSHL